MTEPIVFLQGRNLTLRPMESSDYTDESLRWLNDPAVNVYSQRRPFPYTRESMPLYQKNLEAAGNGYQLAIVETGTGVHVGNIALVNIQSIHRCAEIAILVGGTGAQGRGIGREAIYLVTRHAFAFHNLHKVFAGTFNPAFVACVEGLGWKKEGVFRERIWSDGSYHDQIWLGVLREEFRRQPEYEEV
ncbi:MAG: GNAT family N-acetyltransferase [Proteobacteria bacterium]|nr:GNAT family N-acetyltransferase [Pseudomonadota bacterium]MBU1612586.1 GNAT family N-acetyltransferase [Pseudomonadota bacterium]